jgi:inorganic pyrophosphatase
MPSKPPGWNSPERLEDLPEALPDEIAHFFSIYKNLEQKEVEVEGWYSREDAQAEIEASRARFRERQAKHT